MLRCATMSPESGAVEKEMQGSALFIPAGHVGPLSDGRRGMVILTAGSWI